MAAGTFLITAGQGGGRGPLAHGQGTASRLAALLVQEYKSPGLFGRGALGADPQLANAAAHSGCAPPQADPAAAAEPTEERRGAKLPTPGSTP